jgi:hypothetical protein
LSLDGLELEDEPHAAVAPTMLIPDSGTKGAGGVDQLRNGSVRFPMVANDPRASGTYASVWNGDH